MKTLLFHIGRGGHFNNSGHLSFIGISGISEAPIIKNGEYIYPCCGEDENGNPIDDTNDEAELMDDCGNGIGLTVGQLKANEGKIDLDGDCDTWYTAHSDYLSDMEARAVLKHYKDEVSTLFSDDVELLTEVADNSEISDDIAEYLQGSRYENTQLFNATRKANEWLFDNGYNQIEED